VKNCASQGRKFAQKLHAKAKFAKIASLRKKAKFAQKLRPARSRFSSGTDIRAESVTETETEYHDMLNEKNENSVFADDDGQVLS